MLPETTGKLLPSVSYAVNWNLRIKSYNLKVDGDHKGLVQDQFT